MVEFGEVALAALSDSMSSRLQNHSRFPLLLCQSGDLVEIVLVMQAAECVGAHSWCTKVKVTNSASADVDLRRLAHASESEILGSASGVGVVTFVCSGSRAQAEWGFKRVRAGRARVTPAKPERNCKHNGSKEAI